MTALLWGVLAYVGAQMLLGIWVSRRVANEDDYWLAGRSLGPGLTMFSIFATWFGAETCIGAAGAIYEKGIAGGSADPFGYGGCIVLLGLFLAAPLWRRKLTTLPDLFRARFSGPVEMLAVAVMVPTSIFWAAAQIRAFAQVLAASSSYGVEVTIGFAALTVVVYTGFGGMLADAVTDFVQSLVLIAGLVVLAAALLLQPDAPLLAAFAQLDPARLDWSGGEPLLPNLERWAIPLIGSLVAQEVISRVSASRSARVARGSALAAGVLYIAIGLIPALIGLAGPVLLPDLADSEQLLPLLATRHLPPVVGVLFIGALVSAILSTVNSALLAASSLLAHNLAGRAVPTLDSDAKLRLARGATVVCGVVAYALARGADSVYALVEQSSAFGSAGLVVATGFALFTNFGGAASGAAALVAGAVVWTAGDNGWIALETPYLAALAASFTSYVVLALAVPSSARTEESEVG